jgi:hypothetical protein
MPHHRHPAHEATSMPQHAAASIHNHLSTHHLTHMPPQNTHTPATSTPTTPTCAATPITKQPQRTATSTPTTASTPTALTQAHAPAQHVHTHLLPQVCLNTRPPAQLRRKYCLNSHSCAVSTHAHAHEPRMHCLNMWARDSNDTDERMGEAALGLLAQYFTCSHSIQKYYNRF